MQHQRRCRLSSCAAIVTAASDSAVVIAPTFSLAATAAAYSLATSTPNVPASVANRRIWGVSVEMTERIEA